MSEIIVQAEHLHLSYKNVRAVQDVSFTVGAGDVLSVIGPNGSGKTSTFVCKAGLDVIPKNRTGGNSSETEFRYG